MRVWFRSMLGLLLTFTAFPAIAATPKRVLVVHSFGSVAPPFTTHSTAFETTLTEEMGQRVDLDEVSLDMARYADTDMQEALVEYIRKRQAKWRPDLVVPIGSPAGVFVAQYRDRLFPETPIVYAGLDKRRLPPDALQKNAAFVGEDFNLPGFVEDILQMAPATTNIVVVIGASPLEQYWAAALRQEFAPFTNRVSFTWLNDLSYDQMLERVAQLPPRSFIFLPLLLRDAAGVTHNADEALKQIHAVANAPVNSIFQHQLGLGIVGGRLYQAETEGVEAARIAIRILRGEPASNFPPKIVRPMGPRYDWRELQRWKISEARLPAGSLIEFREPTVWEHYGRQILGILFIALLEAGLIILLVMNLVKRQSAEKRLRESEERLALATESAGTGLWSMDMDSDRVWVTPQTRELFQFSPDEELTFNSFLEKIHPEDRERVRQAVQEAAQHRENLRIEYRVILADGNLRWLVCRGSPQSTGSGKLDLLMGAVLDITERKAAEAALRESEERFRTVADSAPVLIWISGLDRLCTFFNKPWLDFTGRTLDQEMGNGWTEGVHPDDLLASLKIYVDSFDARQPFMMQYRLRRHDGEYRWFTDSGVPRYDAKGNFAGYIGSCVDITERLRAEEKFRLAVEAAPNAMILVDAAGRIVLVNAQTEAVFLYTRDELIGRPVEMLLPEQFSHHPGHRQSFITDPRARSMGAGRDLFGLRKDGREVPVEIGLNPIRTMEGSFVMASVVDITERKQAEERLRLDAAIIENMTDGVALVRASDRIIVHTNSKFGRMLGYEPGELIGQPVTVIGVADGSDSPAMTETILHSLQNTGRWNGQIPNRRKDGTTIWCQVNITTFQHPVHGEVGISVHTDITDRRQAEEEMRRLRLQTWHADRVARTGAITASLAHELNQPLAAVLSNAQAALRFLEKDNPDLGEIREILTDIVSDDKRAGAVISGLRSMLRRQETQREQISLSETIRETMDLLHSELLSRQVQVQLRRKSDCFVFADKSQIQQVILNLMMNATEAMQHQPVDRRRMEVVLEHPKADTAQVAIRDSGTGISEDQGGKLFEAFWTTKSQGLGIGLPICRSIVESHGGRIWFANNGDGGATFYFTLPVETVVPLGRERTHPTPGSKAADHDGKDRHHDIHSR